MPKISRNGPKTKSVYRHSPNKPQDMVKVKIKRITRHKKPVTTKEKLVAGFGVGATLLGGGMGGGARNTQPPPIVSTQNKQSKGSNFFTKFWQNTFGIPQAKAYSISDFEGMDFNTGANGTVLQAGPNDTFTIVDPANPNAPAASQETFSQDATGDFVQNGNPSVTLTSVLSGLNLIPSGTTPTNPPNTSTGTLTINPTSTTVWLLANNQPLTVFLGSDQNYYVSPSGGQFYAPATVTTQNPNTSASTITYTPADNGGYLFLGPNGYYNLTANGYVEVTLSTVENYPSFLTDGTNFYERVSGNLFQDTQNPAAPTTSNFTIPTQPVPVTLGIDTDPISQATTADAANQAASQIQGQISQWSKQAMADQQAWLIQANLAINQNVSDSAANAADLATVSTQYNNVAGNNGSISTIYTNATTSVNTALQNVLQNLQNQGSTTAAPTISLVGAAIYPLTAGTYFDDPGATVSNGSAPLVSGQVPAGSPVGTWPITYSISGTNISVTRTVVITAAPTTANQGILNQAQGYLTTATTAATAAGQDSSNAGSDESLGNVSQMNGYLNDATNTQLPAAQTAAGQINNLFTAADPDTQTALIPYQTNAENAVGTINSSIQQIQNFISNTPVQNPINVNTLPQTLNSENVIWTANSDGTFTGVGSRGGVYRADATGAVTTLIAPPTLPQSTISLTSLPNVINGETVVWTSSSDGTITGRGSHDGVYSADPVTGAVTCTTFPSVSVFTQVIGEENLYQGNDGNYYNKNSDGSYTQTSLPAVTINSTATTAWLVNDGSQVTVYEGGDGYWYMSPQGNNGRYTPDQLTFTDPNGPTQTKTINEVSLGSSTVSGGGEVDIDLVQGQEYTSPSTATVIYNDNQGTDTATISSSNWDADSINNPGSYTIIYSLPNGTKAASLVITVSASTAQTGKINPPVDQTINSGDQFLMPSATYTLSNGQTGTVVGVSSSFDNNNDGTSPQRYIINYSVEDSNGQTLTASSYVVVQPAPPAPASYQITGGGDVSVTPGGNNAVSLTIVGSDNQTATSVNSGVNVSSSDTSIATVSYTVSNGIVNVQVSGVSVGSATITVSYGNAAPVTFNANVQNSDAVEAAVSDASYQAGVAEDAFDAATTDYNAALELQQQGTDQTDQQMQDLIDDITTQYNAATAAVAQISNVDVPAVASDPDASDQVQMSLGAANNAVSGFAAFNNSGGGPITNPNPNPPGGGSGDKNGKDGTDGS